LVKNKIDIALVLAVKKLSTAPIFLNLLDFETERDTSENHEIKSLDLKEIHHCGRSFLLYLVSFQSYRSLKKLEQSILLWLLVREHVTRFPLG